MLCPKLSGVAGPFSLAGLLNQGVAKTGNLKVVRNRDDQGTKGNGKLERLIAKVK